MNILPGLAWKRFTPALIRAALMAVLVLLPAAIHAGETGTLDSVLGQLTGASDLSADSVLKSLGNELGTKARSLGAALTGSPETQAQLTGALQSLLGDKGPATVAAFQKLSAAKLTPAQTDLARQVGQVGSAYLVQKDFGALAGAQSDVAQIVSSLRSGNVTAALPAIKKVSENTSLTSAQKDLLTSLAEKFAPGAKQAGEAIGNGLKSFSGFGK